ncbi:MAG: hypothetical protein U1E89_21110 [Burkholderiaceae bacterium]
MIAPRAATLQVLAVIDDAAACASLLEWSGALAQAVHCDLTVVYVEDTLALRAAALPITQVLAHVGTGWTSFDIPDVERGYRVQAARLRQQTERMAARLELRCSMRTARGALAQAALAVADEAALVVVAPAALRSVPAQASRMPKVLALWADRSQLGAVRRIATQLARGAGGSWAERQVDEAALPAAVGEAQADLIVLPRALAQPGVLARARQPVLLVGEAASSNNHAASE